jgi:two-component system, OmpR family, phosphate regulon sensor histidine kinase PhoR
MESSAMHSGLDDLACMLIVALAVGAALAFLRYRWLGRPAALAAKIDRRLPAATVEQANALLGIIADAAIALDSQGHVALANPAAERLFDAAAYASGERRLAELLSCPGLVESLGSLSRRGATPLETFEIEIVGSATDHRWYHVTARAWIGVEYEHPEQQTVVAVLRDVTKQKTAQRRNAELVSGLSHEMKTPLAGIKAYVELLADGDAEDSATQEEFLGVINSQADRLLRLVDNLVIMAEVEAATSGAGRCRWLLASLLDEALHAVEPHATAKEIVLVTDFDSQCLSVVADRRLFTQATVQLLSNAVKYTPIGGQVVLRSRVVGDRARIEIEDNGVGLCAEDCHKVFDKFYRVASHKEMAPGTGLGLPLARHIVESLHGGTLTVESQVGRGSLFAVELALADLVSDVSNEERIAYGEESLAVR